MLKTQSLVQMILFIYCYTLAKFGYKLEKKVDFFWNPTKYFGIYYLILGT
jgi:hypothetical protein